MWNKLSSIAFVVSLFRVFQKYPYVGCVVSTVFVPDNFWLQQMHTQRSSTWRADFPAASSASHQSSDFFRSINFLIEEWSSVHAPPPSKHTDYRCDDRWSLLGLASNHAPFYLHSSIKNSKSIKIPISTGHKMTRKTCVFFVCFPSVLIGASLGRYLCADSLKIPCKAAEYFSNTSSNRFETTKKPWENQAIWQEKQKIFLKTQGKISSPRPGMKIPGCWGETGRKQKVPSKPVLSLDWRWGAGVARPLRLKPSIKLTLQGINISHLGKRKIIFKMPFLGDMLVSRRVSMLIFPNSPNSPQKKLVFKPLPQALSPDWDSLL